MAGWARATPKSSAWLTTGLRFFLKEMLELYLQSLRNMPQA